VIVKGFIKCCIYNAMDGREDDILWEDEEEVEDVGSENDEVGNNDSGGDEKMGTVKTETNW
jgi:hypothetical protein